ncbi:NIPSNAP family containing protein [Kribbella flavida DSM 17836]|uniref:NIPSNAP family containing protein n=1 Tax=Kribbella flavida (strain DSM 17836 / JCM 10339 / NBRC 14399) TaxID=479435 RepID=D2Q022_KRIFD|nr:NIPSNAP family protein [Kribbella flavida]ADB30020.1 NIPSNAP family containing protein [Kribbella flavida DSM 17836]
MECCAVLDLRQYTLYPGRRDDLIAVFDEAFVEGQEGYGMHVCGQFRDLDDPDRFVWLRGFRSLEARAEALNGFYYGPIWKARSAEANATMKDSDDALLLRPVLLGAGFPALDTPRPPIGATEVPASVVVGTVYHRNSADDGFVQFFTDQVAPVLIASGIALSAVFETLPAENNFPALPLRDETVLVWFATFADDPAYEQHRQRLAESAAWTAVAEELDRRCRKPAQELRLRPTARSQFR